MDFSIIIDTVKGFLTKPTEEWQKIKANPITKEEMLKKIILPLVVVYIVAVLLSTIITGVITPYLLQFIGFGRLFISAIVRSIIMGATAFALIYGGGYVLYALADNFNAKKDDILSLKTMTFSYMISLVSSIAMIIPVIGSLVWAAGSIYSLVLLFWGMKHVLEAPEDKIVLYFILTILIIIVAGAILSFIAGLVGGALIGGSMMH